MDRKFYVGATCFLLLLATANAEAQLGDLKARAKNKAARALEKSNSKSDDDSGDEKEPPKKSLGDDKPAFDNAPKAQAVGGSGKENKRLEGDVRIIEPMGDGDAEHDAIAASKAHDEIIGFRFYLKTCEEEKASGEMDARAKYDFSGNLHKMQEQWAKVKKKDPNYDMSKYEATYKRYDGYEHEVNKAEYASQENTKRINQKITPEQVDEQMVKDFGDQAYFSAQMMSGNRTSWFTHYEPDKVSQGKRVIFEGKKEKDFYFSYPHVDKSEIAYHLDGMKRRMREYSHPVVHLEVHNIHTKGNFNYCAYTSDNYAFIGFTQESDGTIVLMHIPAVDKEEYSKALGQNAALGYNKAYDLYDYGKTEIDVLGKDEATVKGANLDAKKSAMVALAQKSIKEDDKAKEEAHRKEVANTRPDPEGMKVPEIHQNMMEFGQQFWDDVAKQHRDEMGLKGGKLTKIWAVSKDWEITKNDLGIILYRSLYAEGIIHLTNGKCYLYMYHFKEDYSGGGEYTKLLKADWIEAASEDSRRLKEMPCANAK